VSITNDLAATYPILTRSLLYIPQDLLLLFVIIFLCYSTPPTHGYKNTSARSDGIRIEPNDRHFSRYVTPWHRARTVTPHQQKTFPSGRTGCVRVDALRQSRQRHPGDGLLRARRQYHTSSCISPSDRRFAVSSRSVGLLF
jgi:hypothetical protein